MRVGGLEPGVPVVLYLHTPREKLWGILISLESAGIVVRGLDLVVFEEWLRQEMRGEEGLGPATLFYPMSRVERMERDETTGPLESFSDRFERQLGKTVHEVMGLAPPSEGSTH